ncbi:Cytochrome P450-like protein 49 [Elsinoe fawcettii]|nr:Cytochrome P450-like protein 49 [Elsinoe fawcettii]
MALTGLLPFLELFNNSYAVIAIASVVIGLFTFLYQNRTIVPNKTPRFVQGWPIVGCYKFWSARMDFHNENIGASDTGRFSFLVGRKPVVALSGPADRKLFFESSKLDFSKGYEGLLAGSPPAPTDPSKAADDQLDFGKYFARRLVTMLKREQFVKGLPFLMDDTRSRLKELVDQKDKTTDPFESIYRIVFQLTMRTVAAKEIAEDRPTLDKILHLYEMVESASTPAVVMYPRFPSFAMLKRLWGGSKIFMTFDKIIKDRQRTGRREDDPMQYLMDQGDDTLHIITFVMGALFAGQLNSGINAAWLLTFLAANPAWKAACRAEVERVAAKYDPDTTRHLADRLASVPLEGWENDFPLADACLRDSIRLNTNGTAFRKNDSPVPVAVGDEIIPPGWFVTYPIGDVHFDPSLYPDPYSWKPERYVNLDGTPATGPDSAAARHKEAVHPFVGWGVARHPCLGMRFAKLEQNVIIAFWMAYFDWEIDGDGKVPGINHNAFSAEKPREKVRFRYWVREEA